MTIGRKGFTFEQMAVLILVILGLTVGVILASTSLRTSAGSISELGQTATEGTEAAVTATAGIGCTSLGGIICGEECETYIDLGGVRLSATTIGELDVDDEGNPTSNNVAYGSQVGCSNVTAPFCCYVVAE